MKTAILQWEFSVDPFTSCHLHLHLLADGKNKKKILIYADYKQEALEHQIIRCHILLLFFPGEGHAVC